MVTIGQAFNPKQNNFDILRLFAACLVIYSHSFALLGAREPIAYWLGGYDTGGGWAVSIFFVISGFLIARSCLQRSISLYLSSRIMRIIPALAVLLVFDVFIIGPLFSDLSLSDYFRSQGTFDHLVSVSVFQQHTGLPGVFGDGPVNGTIWTLPIEFACYLLLPILSLFFFLRRFLILVPLAALAALYMMAKLDGLSWENQGGLIFAGLPYYSTLKNALFFMVGCTMWVHRDDIPMSAPFAIIAVLLLVIGPFTSWKIPAFYIGLPYLTIYVAVSLPWTIRLQDWPGDLSYGIYLYGFPLQQALIFSSLGSILTPDLLTAAALPLAFCAAYFSWHIVEKPALHLARQRPHRAEVVA